jgi:hypothetical protein
MRTNLETYYYIFYENLYHEITRILEKYTASHIQAGVLVGAQQQSLSHLQYPCHLLKYILFILSCKIKRQKYIFPQIIEHRKDHDICRW